MRQKDGKLSTGSLVHKYLHWPGLGEPAAGGWASVPAGRNVAAESAAAVLQLVH